MAVGRILGHLGKCWFSRRGVSFAGSVIMNGWPILTIRKPGQLAFGHGVVLTSWSKYTALGVSHPVIVRAMTDRARIRIGANAGLSGTTICAAEAISIGDDCLIGADVIIVDTDFHPIAPRERRTTALDAAVSKAVTIGRNVFIGGRSTILKGVTIGDNSVIGAGSVVSRDIPANVIAAGNPCKVLAQLEAASW